LFPALVPWLMLHRDGLTVLVHPNSGRPRDDHLSHALWLGQVLPVKEDVLPLQVGEGGITTIVPNTQPTMAID
jgi:DOPA 4,5-dioxygenase